MRKDGDKLEQLKAEYRLHNSGDAWGDAMAFAFPLCEILYSRDEHDVPELMSFKPGAFGVQLDEEDTVTMMLNEFDTVTLEAFGRMLNRLLNILKAQGRDY